MVNYIALGHSVELCSCVVQDRISIENASAFLLRAKGLVGLDPAR